MRMEEAYWDPVLPLPSYRSTSGRIQRSLEVPWAFEMVQLALGVVRFLEALKVMALGFL